MFRTKKRKSPLPPIQEVPAAHLIGRSLVGGWIVVERLEQSPGATSSDFSVNYIVSDASGQRAFLKALNIAAVLSHGNGSLIDRLKFFSAAYVAECHRAVKVYQGRALQSVPPKRFANVVAALA